MKPDPWGRDPRSVRFWGWVTVAVTLVVLAIVLLIDMPWTKCKC
ncbi:hypothetical protein [uncultured Jatrophihabitans sp.]